MCLAQPHGEAASSSFNLPFLICGVWVCIHIHTCVCLCVQGAHTFIWRTHIFLHFTLLLRQGVSVDPGSYRGLSLPSHLAAGDCLSLWPACWHYRQPLCPPALYVASGTQISAIGKCFPYRIIPQPQPCLPEALWHWPFIWTLCGPAFPSLK